MKGLNKVLLIGNLGAAPDLKHTTSGKARCAFSLAINESWTDAKGEKQENTTWLNCVAWEKTGELCGQYLQKGSLVHIEGKLTVRKYEDESGIKRDRTEVIVRDVIFLDGPKEKPAAAGKQNGGGVITDDDIPF